MSSKTIYKTIHQYNQKPVLKEDMDKLLEIAKDYSKVKNYVYQRYSGIKSLQKIYPGYTVQNEMTKSGLRAELGLPSVYFYLAIFDALGDIKTQWAQIKNRIQKNIKKNPTLTPDDRHYLRFVIKVSKCFEAILIEREIILSGEWKIKYEELRKNVDERRLHLYLCRQVRKHLKKLHTEKVEGFSISKKAYRYENHGIYLAIKEKRKRIFVSLTDGNQYDKQLYINLYPEENRIIICVPVEIKVKCHEDYNRKVGLAMGMIHMFVTNEGNIYGDKYGDYQFELTEYIRQGVSSYQKNRENNPGRKKYYTGKKRLEARLYTYVNTEINRLLVTERPRVIYIPKLPQVSKAGVNKKINYSVSMWQRGYIRNRLIQKCQEHSIKLVEVLGKDISSICSQCGSRGKKMNGKFQCPVCNLEITERINAAKNALKRGIDSD